MNGRDNLETAEPIQVSWLRSHHKEVIRQIIAYVRKDHPNISEIFPRLHIRNMRLEIADSTWTTNNAVLSELRSIFQEVSSEILPPNSAAETWDVDVDVRFANAETNPAMYALLAPNGMLCLSGLIVICPMKATGVVILETTLHTPKDSDISLKAHGGSTTFLSVSWFMDKDAPLQEATAKALTAAVADFSSKIAAEVHKRIPGTRHSL